MKGQKRERLGHDEMGFVWNQHVFNEEEISNRGSDASVTFGDHIFGPETKDCSQ